MRSSALKCSSASCSTAFQSIFGAFVRPVSLAGETGVTVSSAEFLDALAPADGHYAHNDRWHDGNGYSHLRAALLGPSLTVPVHQGQLELGTWQQILLCDFDNKPRQRRVVVRILRDES